MSASKRKVVQLLPYQHNLLRDLVEAEKIPDGQFIRRWAWWRQLVATFNQLTELNFSPEDLHHYVMTLRKRPLGRQPRWEPMGDGCARLPGVVYLKLTPEDRTHLITAYCTLAKRLGRGSDTILVDGKLRRELANMFAAAAGHGINDRSLVAALIDLRKDGLLPKVVSDDAAPSTKRRFDDFDQAAAM